jgi:hypothetical protein
LFFPLVLTFSLVTGLGALAADSTSGVFLGCLGVAKAAKDKKPVLLQRKKQEEFDSSPFPLALSATLSLDLEKTCQPGFAGLAGRLPLRGSAILLQADRPKNDGKL